MKKMIKTPIILVLAISLFSCSEKDKPRLSKPDSGVDMAKVFDTTPDSGNDMDGKDVPADLGASFPDPNRVSKDKCLNSLDCKRGQYCDKDPMFQLCRGLIGCGFFGKAPDDPDWACIIDPIGGAGRLSGVECDDDAICPATMPYCYLRACQVNSPCKKDSDCPGDQFCDWESWCVTPKACQTMEDCIGQGSACGADKICERHTFND